MLECRRVVLAHRRGHDRRRRLRVVQRLMMPQRYAQPGAERLEPVAALDKVRPGQTGDLNRVEPRPRRRIEPPVLRRLPQRALIEPRVRHHRRAADERPQIVQHRRERRRVAHLLGAKPVNARVRRAELLARIDLAVVLRARPIALVPHAAHRADRALPRVRRLDIKAHEAGRHRADSRRADSADHAADQSAACGPPYGNRSAGNRAARYSA